MTPRSTQIQRPAPFWCTRPHNWGGSHQRHIPKPRAACHACHHSRGDVKSGPSLAVWDGHRAAPGTHTPIPSPAVTSHCGLCMGTSPMGPISTLTVSLHHAGDVQLLLHPQQAHAVLEIKGIAGRRKKAAGGAGCPHRTVSGAGTARRDPAAGGRGSAAPGHALQDAHVILHAVRRGRLPVPLVAQRQDVGPHLPQPGSLGGKGSNGRN